MVMNKRAILSIVCLLILIAQVSAVDKVSISNFVISAGETKELSITLNNEVIYAAFQFDLYLPEGLTVSDYSTDQARIPETTTLSMAKQADGSYRFFAAAMKAQNVIGTSGGIVTIKVMADKDLASGSLRGYFRNVKLSKADGTGKKYAEMSFPITVLEPSTVTAKSYTRTYGEDNPVFEYTVTGGVLDGIPEIVCEATKDSPIGTYDIIVKRGTETNFNVTYVKGTLTITKASLKINAGTYTRKKGKENPKFTLTYEGFKNNDTESVLTEMPTVTTTAQKASPVGDYEVKVSGAEAQNYDISYQNGVLTVTINTGDANGDGDITEADVNTIAKYIMGQTPTGFDKEAADVNGDKKINAADIVVLITLIKDLQKE